MNKSKVFLVLLYVILIGGFAYLVISSSGFGLWKNKEESVTKEETKSGDWQAIFLSNGQVYFGKLDKISGDFVNLREIFYLQLAQSPQPEGNKETQQQPKVSLVKLGNELHGPEDTMKINRAHILFIEDMKPDSKVVTAITRYQTQGPDQTEPQSQQQTQPKTNSAENPTNTKQETQTSETGQATEE